MEGKGLVICHECMSLLRQSKRTSQLRFATPIIRQWTGRSFTTTNAPVQQPRRQRDFRQQAKQIQSVRALSHTLRRRANVNPKDLKSLHNRVLELSSTALRPEDNKLPSEQRILYVLEQLESIAHSLIDTRHASTSKSSKAEKDTSATSALLGSVNARQYPAFLSKAALLNLISEKAEEILRHRNIFITPSILKAYIQLQTLLHQPSSFPDIFALYATKPTPKLSKTGHLEFTEVSPDKINSAIDSKTANTALSAAIQAHNLPLCLDIITTTFSTPSYKKSKLLRQAALPFSGLLIAPLTAYAAATQFSLIQSTMDPSYATGIAFAGIMTYISTVAGLGYVVITTANDQMDRVTWAKGVPLWERWIREEERAALDRVAGKWGFQSLERRGEEEGMEWERLREECGVRGMVLDRVELMEGME